MWRMKYKLILLLAFSLIVSLCIVLGVDVEDFNIEKTYSAGENLRGWIEMSLEGESIEAVLRGSIYLDGEINIIDFLEANNLDKDDDYWCVPADCENNYKASGSGEATKSFNLGFGEKKIISVALEEREVKDIKEFKFDAEVSNTESCVNPLKIDVLSDEVIDWRAKDAPGDFSCVSEGGMGCFDSFATTAYTQIGATKYCEKISLPESTKFKLGAFVRKAGDTVGFLTMSLYETDGTPVSGGSCSLPGEPTPSGGEISCTIQYVNTKIQDYYVCISADGNTDYEIKKEESGNVCGFFSNSIPSEHKADYYIFAKAAKFANIGSFNFKDNSDLNTEIINYINNRYNGNCLSKCIIPIKFSSYGNLNINISNLVLRFETDTGVLTTNNFYDTTTESGKVYSDTETLDLGHSEIKVSNDEDEYDIKLYLDGAKIAEEEIKVGGHIIKRLSPLATAAGVKTTFKVYTRISRSRNITKYYWDFGDDEDAETTKNKTTHTYEEIGNYDLIVKVQDDKGNNYSRTFEIVVGSPKDMADSTIQKFKKNINNITKQISSFPSWYKNEIEEIINLDELNSSIISLEKDYADATKDKDYVDIMTSLTELEIPHAVKESGKGNNMPVFFEPSEVKPSYLETLGAGSYEDNRKRDYQNSVFNWYGQKLIARLDFSYVSAYYSGKEQLIAVFKLKITPVEADQNEEIFLVIGQPDVVFKSQDYTERDLNGATGLKFSSFITREIEFAVLGDVSFEDLVIYISPIFSHLDISEPLAKCNYNGKCEKDLGENWKNCRADCGAWGWAILWIIIILTVAVITYIVLHQWYKRNYEKRLFKSINELYNLTNFISGAKSKGVKRSEITKKLRKTGWKREQISYAFKKVRGKDIGMPFDITKLIDKLKIKRKVK